MQASRTMFGSVKVVLADGERFGNHYVGPATVFVPDDPQNNEAAELARLVEAGDVVIAPYVSDLTSQR